MRRPLAVILAMISLAGCRDGELTGPSLFPWLEEPRPAISDGANADGANTSNAHFYFLPEIAKGTSSFSGTFAPDLSPRVRICRVESTAATKPAASACKADLVTFSGTQIQVSTTDQHYKVNWDTDLNPGQPSTYYRIIVSVSGLEAGYADVYVASSAKDLKNNAAGALGLIDGRMLPIKFRLEHGVVSEARAIATGSPSSFTCNDCVEKTISTTSTETQVVTTPSKDAGVAFPAHAFTGTVVESAGQATIVINEVLTRPCLPAPQPQAGECYTFDAFYVNSDGNTEKFTDYFNPDHRPVGGVCIEEALTERFDLAKYSEAGPEQGVRTLEPVVVTFLDCTAPVVLTQSDSRLGRLANAGWNALVRPVARVLAPRLLHAEDTGQGGMMGTFSTVGWLEQVEMEVVAGDGQSARVGSAVPVAPQVRVVTVNHHTTDRLPAAGVPVRFQVGAGSGSVGTAAAAGVEVLTDANGYASAPWTLGTTAGPMTLTANIDSVATATGAATITRTFTATAVGPLSVALSPATDTTLAVGASAPFTATVTNAISNSGVTWASSNPAVATVSSSGNTGTVTAVAQGTATITATSVEDPTKSASLTITVPAPRGDLVITTKDSSGNPIPGATVMIQGTTTGTTTNADGVGRITNQPYGTYTLVASAVGQTFPPSTVTLNAPSVAVDMVANAMTAIYWSADNTYADSTGTHVGTPVGDVSWGSGYKGAAFAFSNGHITAPGAGINSATAITVAAWVNLNANVSASAINRFVNVGPGEKTVLRLDGSDPNAQNKLHSYITRSTGFGPGVDASGVLALRGCWYHVAVTYDGEMLRLYLDGAQVGSTAASGPLATDQTSGIVLSHDGTEKLNGLLDEVRIYSVALDATRIAALAGQAGTGTKCSNM